MTQVSQLSRRQALKLFSGVPLLPLAALGGTVLLAGCGGSSTAATPAAAAAPTSASFTPMAAPTLTDASAMATTSVASSLSVAYRDGSTQSYKLGYQPFFITGDQVPNLQGGTILAGGYFDISGKPIVDTSVPGQER